MIVPWGARFFVKKAYPVLEVPPEESELALRKLFQSVQKNILFSRFAEHGNLNLPLIGSIKMVGLWYIYNTISVGGTVFSILKSLDTPNGN